MPATHSAFNDVICPSVSGIAFLPLKTRTRGVADVIHDANEEDIVDEALKLYKPNTLFRTFDIHGSADRTLIYAILYTTDALARLSTAFPKGTPPTQTEAARILNAHAMDTFALPGDAAFPRIHTLTAPTSRADADRLRQYLSQIRQEIVLRLVPRLYTPSAPDIAWKSWICFARRKFMGFSLSPDAGR